MAVHNNFITLIWTHKAQNVIVTLSRNWVFKKCVKIQLNVGATLIDQYIEPRVAGNSAFLTTWLN